MTVNVKKFLIVLFILFGGISASVADGSYKNELTKVSLTPIGRDDVKITLYMAKPYSEPLRLLRKNDGEFVLILPETYSSAPQKPSISDVIGEVTDADVRLYSFISNSTQNGYTKIVIKTNGLVNLYPEAVTSGGGTFVDRAQQEYHKIAVSQTPATTKTSEQTVNTDKNNQVSQSVKKEKTQQAAVNIKTDVKKNKTEDSVKKTTSPIPETVVETSPIVNLPKISEQKMTNNIDVPLEEVSEENLITSDSEQIKNSEISKEKSPSKIGLFFSTVKSNVIYSVKSVFNKLKNAGHNNWLIVFASLFVLGMALKLSKSIIKSANPADNDLLSAELSKKNEVYSKTKSENRDEEEQDKKYSDFFKTIIESEIKGDNPFNLDKSENTETSSFETDVMPVKSHEEVMNEDQNLTWQEKFRALQKNKKALFKEDEASPAADIIMENTENMNIENPIKKLTQDFKAVRKVLEKQRAKKQGMSDSINQDFTPDKIDKIEVISFEDYQNNISKPKVQIKNTTAPIKSNPPKVLTQLPFSDNKGLYLVDYKDKISLMGYVNDKVFKLNTYDRLDDTKLYARMSEKNENTETYIVKFDNNKMLIDVDENQMKLKLMY